MRARRRGGGERRGAVLPLVCVLLTVLLGFAALAVDFGRLYHTAAEVQAAADAAALAAARGWQRDTSRAAAAALAQAQQVVAGNRVGGAAAAVQAADVVPISYDPPTRAVAASAWDRNVGVQVTVRGRVSYLLAGGLGLAAPTVTRTATAWVANVTGATCVRPFTLPYTRVYESIGGLHERPWTSKGHQAPDLTQAGVAAWSSLRGLSPVRRTVVMVPPWQNADSATKAGNYNVGEWHTANFTGGTVKANEGFFTTYFGEPAGSPNCQAAAARVTDMLTPYVWPRSDTLVILRAAIAGIGAKLCHQGGSPGDATCRDARAAMGVRTRVALADSIPVGSAFGNRVRVVTQARIMCFFRSTADVCPSTQIKDEHGVVSPWHMPPHPYTGAVADRRYPAGTIAVMLEGPASLDLTRDLVMDNRVGLTQRLLLVR